MLVATLVSAGLHAGFLFGFGATKKKAVARPEVPMIAVALMIPQAQELEELDPAPSDERVQSDEVFTPVPMQQDLPQVPQPSDFVQQIDFSSLIERPDFTQAKLISIPETARRGGKVTEGLGTIFNLADLDRAPVPIFQPEPIVPASLKQEGVSGSVYVEFIVNTEGRVLNAIAVRSTDYRFEDPALIGVARWKFKPGTKGGRKVNTRMGVPINFNILTSSD